MRNLTASLIPTGEGFQIIDLLLGGDQILEPADLVNCRLPTDIDWHQGVVINGRAPLWLYSHLVGRCIGAPWVGVNDPRHGAIVVAARATSPRKVGDIIPFDVLEPYLPKPIDGRRYPGHAVALAGPPHSGKSQLLQAVLRGLKQRLEADWFQRGVFVVRACPDGEGNWTAEIPQDRVIPLRYKGEFTDKLADRACQDLANARRQKGLVLVDCGGKIDDKNEKIWSWCTHALIVCANPDDFPEWRRAVTKCRLDVIAEVESSLDPRCEVLSETPLRLAVGPLDRGKQATAPEVLLDRLANLAQA